MKYMPVVGRIVVALLVACITLIEPVHAQWTYVGLSGILVTDLTIHADTLYASTYDGIYKKYLPGADTFWTPCGMQGKHVVQTLVPNGQTFICVVEIDSTEMTQIYRSTNSGSSFQLLDTSVGRAGYNFLHKIAHPGDNYDTLYLVNQRKKTSDQGASWDSMDNVSWGHFIEVNPGNHSQIIVGGEGGFFNAVLESSSDFGKTWTFADMNGYFAGDNALHALAMNGHDWFGVGEGVICKTSDGGNTWTQLINTWSYPGQWQLYIFDVAFSPNDTTRIYATGDGREAYKVPLLYSPDYGKTWDTLSYATPAMPHILSLAVQGLAGRDKVFLGGLGVFQYENIFTGIRVSDPLPPDHYSLSDNYPNPFNPATTIEFSLPEKDHVTLRIFTSLGQCLTTLVDEELFPGTYRVHWNARGNASGVYYYRINAGTYEETRRSMFMK